MKMKCKICEQHISDFKDYCEDCILTIRKMKDFIESSCIVCEYCGRIIQRRDAKPEEISENCCIDCYEEYII